MISTKTISVVMCTYNGEKYLREQLDSIVSQTYPIYELIIQDDKSTDSTTEIIKEYATRHSYIRWQINEQNIGYNANFRTALQSAQGELIAIADQDDIWYSNKIEELVKSIGDYSMCYSFSACPGQENVNEIIPFLNSNNSLERLLFSNVIPGHAMLLQKKFVDDIHFWNDDIFYDWWLAINAYLHNGACQCKQILTEHRIHAESVIAGYKKTKVKAYIPYIKGYSSFKMLQEKAAWKDFYQYIYNESKNIEQLTIANHITKIMLTKGITSFLTLCFLSMKHRKKLMPRLNINWFRAFFYPCFYSYQNDFFDAHNQNKKTL